MNVRKRWRELLKTPGLTLVPGAYDALSARIIEAQGFDAIVGGGYAAVGSLLAEPDGGQSNVRDYGDHYARMCDAVNIPVYVDADTGFGGVHNVRRMVRIFERAGVAGLFISDQVFPNRCGYMPGKSVVSAEEMIARLKAALDARTDPDMFIVARTDAKQIISPEEALERCHMALESGVDMAKPHGFDSAEEIERVKRELPPPYVATLSHAAGKWAVTLGRSTRTGRTVTTSSISVTSTMPARPLRSASNPRVIWPRARSLAVRVPTGAAPSAAAPTALAAFTPRRSADYGTACLAKAATSSSM